MNENVAQTLRRGYVRLNEHIWRYHGTVSICGAAPSLADTYRKLSGDVLAVNSALGFLLDHEVIPRWAMIWDASPLCMQFAVPHPNVTYLVGARCHPAVFERLSGCRVIVWHAAGDHNIEEFLRERGVCEPLISGGSAGVTRAAYLAYALGYREIHFHGADSSYRDNETHVRGSVVPEKKFRAYMGGRWWTTTPEWCAQIEEFKMIWKLFHHPQFGVRLTVHGDGMLPHAAKFLAMNTQLLERAA